MDDEHRKRATRRAILHAGLAMAVAGAGMSLVAQRAAAEDDQKVDRKLLNYQDHPNNAQHCSICLQFVAPDNCRIVIGAISPEGWCAAFSPKAS